MLFLQGFGRLFTSSGMLPVNKLMSGRMKLDQINEGFDLLHEGKAVRQVVTF